MNFIKLISLSLFLVAKVGASAGEDFDLDQAKDDMRKAIAGASGKPIHLVLGGLPTDDHLKSHEFVRIFLDNNPCRAAFSSVASPVYQGNFNEQSVWKDLANNYPGAFDAIYFDISVTKFVLWDNPILKSVLTCLKSGGALHVPEMSSATKRPTIGISYLPLKDYPAYTFHHWTAKHDVENELPWMGMETGTIIVKPLRGTCIRVMEHEGYWHYNPSLFYDTFLSGPVYRSTIMSVTFTQAYAGYPDIGLEGRAEAFPDVFGPWLKNFQFFTVVRK